MGNLPIKEKKPLFAELDRKARANGFEDMDHAVRSGRCDRHPAFEPTNCPACGTSARIGGN